MNGQIMTTPAQAPEPFVHQKNVLLTTYRRDGTPVHIAVDGDRAFIRTFQPTRKAASVS
jgi:hypothetical protein